MTTRVADGAPIALAGDVNTPSKDDAEVKHELR